MMMVVGKMGVTKSTKDLGLFGWMKEKSQGAKLDLQMGFFFFFLFYYLIRFLKVSFGTKIPI